MGYSRLLNEEQKERLNQLTAARAEQEKAVQAQPDYGPAPCVLGVIDAALGRKDEALGEGRRAMELLPVEKDSFNGVHTYGQLKLLPYWDPLRGDPRFEAIVASLAPKDAK
ncbi:MAG: hypothetical protein H0T95_02965 [Chthoniobacterales bacterium]|nr:hypothetical protein [Chthoniobacterales bacterium]MBA3762347.1 hypothetical protein [Chthoniobacterales bacterium]